MRYRTNEYRCCVRFFIFTPTRRDLACFLLPECTARNSLAARGVRNPLGSGCVPSSEYNQR